MILQKKSVFQFFILLFPLISFANEEFLYTETSTSLNLENDIELNSPLPVYTLGPEVWLGGWFQDNNGQPDGFINGGQHSFNFPSMTLDAGPGVTETQTVLSGAGTVFRVTGATEPTLSGAMNANDYLEVTLTTARDLVISKYTGKGAGNFRTALVHVATNGDETVLVDGLLINNASNNTTATGTGNFVIPTGSFTLRMYFYNVGGTISFDNPAMLGHEALNFCNPATAGDCDNDGVDNLVDCDPDDASVGNLVGTSCNDGDASTTNDVYTDCTTCAGTPCDLTDPTADCDGDGELNGTDCNPSDNTLTYKIGDSCNDNDANTDNDVWTSCNTCAGVACDMSDPNEDCDGDGELNGTDCNPNDATQTYKIGDSCDDGDASTINDVYTDCTTCAGSPNNVIMNTCPTSTVDLDALHNGPIPTGTDLIWSTDNDETDGISPVVTDGATVAIDGIYYAYYHDAANDCYSPGFGPVEVIIEECCTVEGMTPNIVLPSGN